MVIKPKIRGFICTTAHPNGCKKNIENDIHYIINQKALDSVPKRVLVIGSSSGYGMASRISSAFGFNAATIGVFFEKPASDKRTGTAGWYNTIAFDQAAQKKGLYSKSINCDAFSNEAKEKVIELIKSDLGEIDLVIYSLASPVRKLPSTGEIVRSVLKPIGTTYQATAIDTNTDKLFEANVEPASNQEIKDTVTVMGGQDWELWINSLSDANVLAKNCKTITYSYIGTELTWPIYWNGTIGQAKLDLDRAAKSLDKKLKKINGSANVVVLKSVVTQASSAIPVMPLYIAMVFKKMRENNMHEGCIEQIWRLMSENLYHPSKSSSIDEENRIRLDNKELNPEIQNHCKTVWPQLTNNNINVLTDYKNYKTEFLNLFGFSLDGVDYDTDVDINPENNILNL